VSYKNKKARYRPYDYAYIALWNSNRTTASNLESKDNKEFLNANFYVPRKYLLPGMNESSFVAM
jgi:hypothetical protein